MDIKEFTKQQGTFLKAEHVEASPTKTFVIIGEATVEHNEKFDTDRLHMIGEMDETEFTFDCSKTNARTIEVVLKSDTKQWIGKELVLETYKTKTSEGKMVNAINVQEVRV